MDVIIQNSAAEAVALTAAIMESAIRSEPDLALGLATGGTMEDVYRALVRKHREEGLDFSRVHTFNLDEYVGLPPEHPQSYRTYMRQHFFDAVGIDAGRGRLPDGMASDPDEECRRYEAAIQAAGGIGLQLLGMGRNGHIGFNEPLSSFLARTRAVVLSPETLKQNGGYFGGEEHMPRRALTMGVGTILESRRCLMLVTGAAKSVMLARAIEGPMTSLISATALQQHPHCTVICDAEAAADLTLRDYYDAMFREDPAWAPYR